MSQKQKPTHRTFTDEFENSRCKRFRADTRDERKRHGSLIISKIANQLYHLQQNDKPQARSDRVSQQKMQDAGKMLSEKEQRNEQIPPQKIPDDDNVLFDDQISNDQIMPRYMPDNDTSPFENQY